MEDNLRVIQWYPGHMAKTRRLMKEKMEVVDIIFELVDARVPLSSRNPFINEMIGNKPHILLLNKSDLADKNETKKFIEEFRKRGLLAIDVVASEKESINKILKLADEAYEPERLKRQAKGLKDRRIRAMIVGVPNVGKSTLINKIAGKKVAVTGDKAGVTRTNQWIKLSDTIDLLDTPGILWNKFYNDDQAYRLALTGAIKKEVLPMDDVVIYGLKFLNEMYNANLDKRYKLSEGIEKGLVDFEDIVSVLDYIGKGRGCLLRGKEVDYDRVYNVFFNDLKDGYLGTITYDRTSEFERFE